MLRLSREQSQARLNYAVKTPRNKLYINSISLYPAHERFAVWERAKKSEGIGGIRFGASTAPKS